jgi:hypothetical protein
VDVNENTAGTRKPILTGHMSRSPLVVAGTLEFSDKTVGPLLAGHRFCSLRLEPSFEAARSAQRRDTAIIAVFKATRIRLAELAGLRYDPGDPRRSDIDLWQREINVASISIWLRDPVP